FVGRGQVLQHALADPDGRRGRVETVVPQGLRPVVAQVGRYRAAIARGSRGQVPQHAVLERQYRRLVDLEDAGRLRPVQPVRPGVQTGAEDDHLTGAAVAQDVVE